MREHSANDSTAPHKTRRLVIGGIILALLLSPWILGAAFIVGGNLYGTMDEWRYRPASEFREANWKSGDLKYRYSVLDHVAAKIVIPGMTQREVENLLGKPDSVPNEGEWQYESKRPGWRFIEFSGGGLLLEFDTEGKLARTTRNTWGD